jgi:hypothetical protein
MSMMTSMEFSLAEYSAEHNVALKHRNYPKKTRKNVIVMQNGTI